MKKLVIFVLAILSTSAYATQSLKESVYPSVTNFPFEIRVNPLSDIIYKISITNKKNKQTQTIESMSNPPLTADHLIQIKDLNNDGYPDIILKGFPVAASAINGNELYMFNSKTEQFVETEDITQLGEIHANRKNCIYVEYRKNAMEYAQDHYCWRNGRWNFIKTK